MNLLKLIPVRILTNRLPQILAYLLTKVLTYLFKKYPHKSQYYMRELDEISKAVQTTIDAAKDGEITEQEILKCENMWRRAIKF